VYWVHIELVYGRWFGKWKGSLSLAECAFWALVLIVAMVALCHINKKNWCWPAWGIGSFSRIEPQRVSGD
jgi:hypothetical protein